MAPPGGEEREGEGGGCGRPDDPGLTAPPAGQVAVLQQLKSILSSQLAVSSEESAVPTPPDTTASLSLPGQPRPCPADTDLGQFDYYKENCCRPGPAQSEHN